MPKPVTASAARAAAEQLDKIDTKPAREAARAWRKVADEKDRK